MEYIRKQFSTLKERILESRKFMQVLAGPRQVGKSTLVGQVLSQVSIPYAMEVADAVEPKDSDWIRRVWESARTTMMIRGEKEYLLVIDEIQKIDNWSEVVKREWDADTRNKVNLKVVLLGSSRLLLKKGLTAYKGRSFVTDRTDTQAWGRWVESAVGAHLLSMADELDYEVYYWREPARNREEKDKEVDFIIECNGELTAIEVKNGRRRMNSGMPAFMEYFHPKRSFVVGTGGVSLEDFLWCDLKALL